MAVVAAAPYAVVLGTEQDQLKVALRRDSAFNRRIEARPTRAAVELRG